MNKISVDLVIKPETDPRALAGGLARLTQVKKKFDLSGIERGENILNSLRVMGHTSLLEPMHFGFIINNGSRVLLAQITRHRQCSFVSQSQQYQDHFDFPYLTIPDLRGELAARYHDLMETAADLYADLIAGGHSKDQARYVIPGAARNDLFIYANARELIEVIFPQRLCKRNTLEVRYAVTLMMQAMIDAGYEYLVQGAGPACVTTGKCDQGKMACGRPFTSWEAILTLEE